MSRAKQIELSSDREEAAEEIFDQALAVSAEERLAFVKTACGGDDTVEREVLALLKAFEAAPEALFNAPTSELRAALDYKSGKLAAHEGDFRPRSLGKYLLLRRIGAGGMAEIFHAIATGPAGFEKQVCLKSVLPSLTSEASLAELFEKEARLSGLLSHGNIAQVYDFFRERKNFYLALEFVDGKNVAQVREKLGGAPVPAPIACYIVAEAAKGLAYAHSLRNAAQGVPLGIIHRDVSPKNIMLSYEGEVKIIDFGIAKARHSIAFTRSVNLRGTFNYLSPEQAGGKQIDHRSDIFNLGLVLYELLTGKPLFRADQLLKSLAEISNFEKVDTGDLPKDLAAILRKALAVRPDERYGSAEELQRELHLYVAKHASGGGPHLFSPWMKELFHDEIGAERENLRRALATQPSSITTVVPLLPPLPARPEAKPIKLIYPAVPGVVVPRVGKSVNWLSRTAFAMLAAFFVFLLTRPEKWDLTTVFAWLAPGQTPPAPAAVVGYSELELTFSHDVRIYLDENYLAQTIALNPYKVTLPIGRMHHFRFVNEKLGLGAEIKYELTSEKPLKAFIELRPRQ